MRVREGCGGKGAAECLCGMQHTSSLASTVCVWGGGGGGNRVKGRKIRRRATRLFESANRCMLMAHKSHFDMVVLLIS